MELTEYRKKFEEARRKEGAERIKIIKDLLDQYINDREILEKARVYGKTGEIKKIEEILNLELEMKSELWPPQKSVNKRDRIKEILENADKDLESSVFIEFAIEAAKVANTLTPEQLEKMFTI
jgi:hypothetical protein